MDVSEQYAVAELNLQFSVSDLRKAARREGITYAGEMRKNELARALVRLGRSVSDVRESVAWFDA